MDDTRPPFGSWRRTYWIACALAAVTMLLLWLLTAAFNLPRSAS